MSPEECATHPVVRKHFRAVQEWAEEQRCTDNSVERLFYCRAMALIPSDVAEAARLMVEVGIYRARLILYERKESGGLLQLYARLIQFLLSHGVFPDDCYHYIKAA